MPMGRGRAVAAATLLRSIKVVEQVNPSPRYAAMASVTRHMTYEERWRLCHREGAWDVLLHDLALFQFRPPGVDGGYSLSYLPSPYQASGYRRFLREQLDVTYDQVGDSFSEDYDHYLDDAELREHVTPVRFDYDPRGYDPGTHPVAHLHIGESNALRIATQVLLDPPAFVWLVLRCFYPRDWKRSISKRLAAHGFDTVLAQVRGRCQRLPEAFTEDDLSKLQPWFVAAGFHLPS